MKKGTDHRWLTPEPTLYESSGSTMYYKRRAISIPMIMISRLFPNVVLEGCPDLIESTIPFAVGGKENYGFWTQSMPTQVYTF